jgi:hypothetical protein
LGCECRWDDESAGGQKLQPGGREAITQALGILAKVYSELGENVDWNSLTVDKFNHLWEEVVRGVEAQESAQAQAAVNQEAKMESGVQHQEPPQARAEHFNCLTPRFNVD